MTAAGCDVVVATADQTSAEIAVAARAADALLGATFRGGVMDRSFLEGIANLRVVAKYTIGVDDVDVDAATEFGILVTHCPTEANWGGVAEGTVAMLLALLKKVRERDRHVKLGGWRADELQGVYCGARGDGYPGITVGIVGLGRVGGRVAELLRPWRMRLLAHDPYIPAETFTRHGVEAVGLRELLGACDVVTLHCNLTRDTRGLIDAARLESMKPGAVLINTARGPVVELEALCDALESGRVGAAALDVLPIEPPPAGSRVLGLGDRVLLFPHMVAANQGGTLGTAIPWATAAVLAALRGEVPEHVYNGEAVRQWRQRFGGWSLL
jgi:phosphoglycerate dehydrogenase-like enzyme